MIFTPGRSGNQADCPERNLQKLLGRSQLKPAERARAARVRVPMRDCQVLLGRGYVCSCFSCVGCGPSSTTKPSQETYGLASLALVAALACLAVLGVLCVVRLTMRSPSSKRPSARAQRAGECPRRESQVLLGRGYVCSCFSCVGCGPSSSCNALRSLRERRMVLLLLPRLRLLLVLQCLAFSASPASRSMIARFSMRV